MFVTKKKYNDLKKLCDQVLLDYASLASENQKLEITIQNLTEKTQDVKQKRRKKGS